MRFCERCGAAFRASRTCPRDGIPTRADLTDPMLGRVLGDRYRVLDRVGAGGMGIVYRAAHTRIACLFAVKMLYGDIAHDPQVLSRFLREAEVASCLSSRHIVRIVDFGQSEAGLPYLTMEYLDGPTLYDEIARRGPLAPWRAARVAQHVARGLAHAHERGIIHRDMKSENVLLVREDDEADVAKLLDFGVASLRDGERLTRAGTVIGTPLYMAPEQLLGRELDARTDLYSLGVVLFEAIAGVPPFDSTSVSELSVMHQQMAPPSLVPYLERAGCDDALDAVVQRLLAKRADDRFASARELAQALAPLTEPPAARPSRPAPSRQVALVPVVDPALRALIEGAIVTGAPVYNAGDHAGCFAVYRRVAEEALARGIRPLAVAARLRAALGRAALLGSPTLAAWEVRYAFDDLLATESTPASDDPLSQELASHAVVASAREAAGHLDVVAAYHASFLELLLPVLRQPSATPPPQPALAIAEGALAEADLRGRTSAVLATLASAIDGLRPGALARPTAFGATVPALALSLPPPVTMRHSSPPSAPSPASAPGSSRGAPVSSPLPAPPVIDHDVADALVRAIHVGAPAYNAGRIDVCHRVYRDTAGALAEGARRDPAGAELARYLDDALARTAGRSDTDAAWVLRRAFDALLARRAS